MTQRGDTGRREVVGVDVVGVAVIGRAQRRQPLVQALDGQTVGSIDTRGAQDRDFDAGPLAP